MFRMALSGIGSEEENAQRSAFGVPSDRRETGGPQLAELARRLERLAARG